MGHGSHAMGHDPSILRFINYLDVREIIRLVISGHFIDCFEDCQVRVIYVFRCSVVATTIKFSCPNLIKLEMFSNKSEDLRACPPILPKAILPKAILPKAILPKGHHAESHLAESVDTIINSFEWSVMM